MNYPHPRSRLMQISSRQTRGAQRGVVLIVALVVLVAMSLGGIAIMRSVDTSTLIAGNMAFKQRTLRGAEAGIEAAINWVNANGAALNTDSSGPGQSGYYSSVSPTDRFKWELASSWDNAKLVGTDAAGNTVHYMIHRMCSMPGVGISAANQLCATDAGSGGTNFEKPGEGASNVGGGTPFTARSKMYLRITVRSAGPRNAVSYLQAMILISA